MAKLLLLWNAVPDRQKEFEEVLDRLLSGLGSFPGVRDVAFNVAMPPSSTFRSAPGEPRYGCLVEVDVKSPSALSQLWSDPDFRRLLEEAMAAVADFTALSFQRTVTARDIMSRDLVAILPAATFRELVELLARHRISGVPVVEEGGRLVGVATEADVLARSGATVADIMTRQVLTVTEDTPVDDIGRLLARERIRRVPVVRGERVLGIVSREDVVRAMASL
ncbi:MAG TPA: CBS domain-containing protein [Dehalococcoidia bacterium]|nr:CBS domain-containing protein [Dehalococcoidia bacterium]